MITIAAVDPGITTGIVIIDASGKIIAIDSLRNAKTSDIIKFLLKYGKPIIIASDVNPVPRKVKTIATKIGATLFYPEKPIRVSEKLKIARKINYEFKNYHEVDAFAAAIKAYKRYRNFFEKIKRKSKNQKEFEQIAKQLILNKKSWVSK